MNTKKILIVEDDKFLLDSYKTKLQKEDFSVSQAQNGEEALTSVNDKIPDLIILDLIMPKMDGLTFLGKLKENENWKNIPVLIASNLDNSDAVKQGMEMGAEEYFVKSNISINDLVEKCRKYLN